MVADVAIGPIAHFCWLPLGVVAKHLSARIILASYGGAVDSVES